MPTPQDLLYANGWLFAIANHIKVNNLWVPWDGSISGTIVSTITNDGTFATPARQDTGNTSLASILAQLDVALSTRASQATIASILTLLAAALDTTLSSRALESGGNLAASAASLSVLDDWDESDRAKVNPIAGQVGIQGNTGVVNALTQRVVLATDVGLPAGTAILGNIKDAGYQNTTWAVHHIPAANTQATITQASAGGSTKNVCLGFTGTICSSSTTAPAAIQLTLNLIDGSTGGTTYLWRTVISLPAVAGAITSFNIRAPHGFEGSAATAMTIEFSAAGGANTIESVSMYGTTRL